MNIKCRKCGKAHIIPDDTVLNRKVYFFCSSCSNKIHVDARKELFHEDRIAASGKGCSDMSFDRIFSGFRFGFVPEAIVAGVVYFLFVLAILVSGAILIGRNAAFFSTNRIFSVICVSVIILFLIYSYHLLLYLISRIILFKKRNPSCRHADMRIVLFDFKDDAVTVFITSCGLFAAAVLVSVPALFLKSGSMLYSSFAVPAAAFMFFFSIVFYLFNNFTAASIALDSFLPMETIRSLIKFFFREFFNIPFYVFVIELLFGFFYSVISSFALFSVVAAFSICCGISFPWNDFAAVAMKFAAGISGTASGPQIPFIVSAGGIAVIITAVIAASLIFSSYVNIRQALYLEAVLIMKSNPSKSVDRRLILIFILLVSGAIFGSIAFFASNLINLFSSLVKMFSGLGLMM